MLNLVKTISTQIVTPFGTAIKKRLVKVLRYGLSNVETAPEAAPYGTDSNPVKNIYAVYAETDAKGRQVIIGYINEQQLAAIGEHRIFSTDENGLLKFQVWLHSNATCEFGTVIGGSVNHLTQFEALLTAFNQLKADHNDLVSKFNTHKHLGVTTGPGVSGITDTTESSSTADMTSAKINSMIVP